jgi:hypothetical protein
MRGGVDLLKLADGNLCVHLRALQVAMAEHLLDKANVRAPLQHQRGHGVPEHVTRPGAGPVFWPGPALEFGAALGEARKRPVCGAGYWPALAVRERSCCLALWLGAGAATALQLASLTSDAAGHQNSSIGRKKLVIYFCGRFRKFRPNSRAVWRLMLQGANR